MKNKALYFNSIKLAFLGLFITFLSTGLPTTALQAQEGKFNDLFATPQGNFANTPTAIARLDAELTIMRIAMSNMNPLSPAYMEMDAKYAYFDLIRLTLMDSKSTDSKVTAEAIGTAFSIFGSEQFSNINRNVKWGFRNSAIDLLRE